MLTFLLICLVSGAIGAILQGMVGIGTGIVVIPLLTFILPHYGIPSGLAVHIALATSMTVIVINTISALISHYRRGNVQWVLCKQMVGFSAFGAFLGALVATRISGEYLQLIFGIFMISLATYMLLKKAKPDATAIPAPLPLLTQASAGLSIGFIGSIIGTGGATLMVPFLQAQKLKMRYAVGTATLMGLPISLVGALTYIIAGLSTASTSVTIGYVHWPAFLAITAAGIFCAPLGAKLSTVLPTRILRIIFAFCMIAVGCKMVWL